MDADVRQNPESSPQGSSPPTDGAPAQRGRNGANAILAGLLAAGLTLKEAAEQAGVSERTARRRWHDPRFLAHVRQLQADMVSQALGRTVDGMSEAAQELRRLMKEASKDAVKLGAAKALIELGVRLRENLELEARIAALEQAREEEGKNGTARRTR